MKLLYLWLVACAFFVSACATPENRFFSHADQWHQRTIAAGW